MMSLYVVFAQQMILLTKPKKIKNRAGLTRGKIATYMSLNMNEYLAA